MTRSLQSSLGILLLILFTGTFGYMEIEGWQAFDALYMTVVTLSTVGYGETHPLSPAGKMFTMLLIILGIGNVAFVFRTLSLELLNPFIGRAVKEKKMLKQLNKLSGHYIVCGYGRIGKDVISTLVKSGQQVVLVDLARSVSEELEMLVPVIHGDASSEEILEKAGILRAKGLVACVQSEAENVFITMTAREMNADLTIIARFEEESTQKKLLRAGADRVINPYHIGSAHISQIIVKPTISRILDSSGPESGLNMNFEEIDLKTTHPWLGQTIRECDIRASFNAIFVAIEKTSGEIVSNPGADYLFEPFDRVVLIADSANFKRLFEAYER